MKAAEFCYWLQGYFELSEKSALSEEQGEMVKRHLGLVFKHELDAPDPTGELQALHDGTAPIKLNPAAPVYRC
jgi:hypothetical protein